MNNSTEIVKTTAEVALTDLSVTEIKSAGYTEYSLNNLSSLGVAGNALKGFIDSGMSGGGEGIYKVTFPQGVSGSLSKFKNEDAYLGSINNHGIKGQARLKKVQYNPTELFMALALLDIEHKLGEIMETQQEILQFIHAVEEARIRGNIKAINDAIENYPYNWNEDKFIRQNIALVGNIKNDAEKSKALYCNQIERIINVPDVPHTVTKAGKEAQRLIENCNNYHAAVYLWQYALYFETILIGNYSSNNLRHIKDVLDKDNLEFGQFIDKCAAWLSKYIGSSIGHQAAPLLRKTDAVVGKVFEKLPFEFEKFYQQDAEMYQPAEVQADKVSNLKPDETQEFSKAIASIDCLHNSDGLEIYLDGESIYLPEPDQKEAPDSLYFTDKFVISGLTRFWF